MNNEDMSNMIQKLSSMINNSKSENTENNIDYIPCIAWGRNARFCENMEVGTEIKVIGRVQSRMYEKKHEDGTVENRVAYEVSIGSLEIANQEEVEGEVEAEEAIQI